MESLDTDNIKLIVGTEHLVTTKNILSLCSYFDDLIKQDEITLPSSISPQTMRSVLALLGDPNYTFPSYPHYKALEFLYEAAPFKLGVQLLGRTDSEEPCNVFDCLSGSPPEDFLASLTLNDLHLILEAHYDAIDDDSVEPYFSLYVKWIERDLRKCSRDEICRFVRYAHNWNRTIRLFVVVYNWKTKTYNREDIAKVVAMIRKLHIKIDLGELLTSIA